MDTLFISCNLNNDKQLAKLNSKHSMCRFEFVECFLRLAIAKHIECPVEFNRRKVAAAGGERSASVLGEVPSPDHAGMHQAQDLTEAVAWFVEQTVVPAVPRAARSPSDLFRKARLYSEAMDDLLFANLQPLAALFARYSPKTLRKGLTRQRTEMDIQEWLAMLVDLDLITEQCPQRLAVLSFIEASLYEPDEFKVAQKERLSFSDFMEALCRLACRKATPSDEELSEAGDEGGPMGTLEYFQVAARAVAVAVPMRPPARSHSRPSIHCLPAFAIAYPLWEHVISPGSGTVCSRVCLPSVASPRMAVRVRVPFPRRWRLTPRTATPRTVTGSDTTCP